MKVNPLDEAFLEWFAGFYRITAQDMPAEQRKQIECAFYAGASSTLRVSRTAVAEGVGMHLFRISKP